MEIDVTYNTKRINLSLADQQGLDDIELVIVDVLQGRIKEILDNPEKVELGPEDSVPDVVQAFEFVLQSLWKFPLNSNYHRYQNRIKGCTCPAIDNLDMIGTKYRYINSECPFHGPKKD